MASLDDQEQFFGNDKHFKVLKKSIVERNAQIWNDFVASMGPRFRADLRGVNLQGQCVAGFKLVGARLDNACFDDADLTGTDLSYAQLTGATLRNAVIKDTKLKVPVKIRAQKVESAPEAGTSPENARRRKLDAMQKQAQALLEERAAKLKAQEKLEARVKARNNPQPFQRED